LGSRFGFLFELEELTPSLGENRSWIPCAFISMDGSWVGERSIRVFGMSSGENNVWTILAWFHL